MTSAATGRPQLQFGEFVLDEFLAALYRDGTEVYLRRQSFEVLKYLANNANRLVTKDELFAAVWPGSVVTDDSLTQCLVEIRRGLGDDGRALIRTVPRRGYVFDVSVNAVTDEAPPVPVVAQALSRSTGNRSRWLAMAAIVLMGAGTLWWAASRSPERARELPGPAAGVAIAVLPFTDLSDGQDQQYFAEGLSEEILNLLAQLPELRVIARTSSFAFRDRQDADIADIATRLRVSHVLEGSVRKAGDRVRITAQLVAAADSSHLWSNTYDREIGDLLSVQGEIAGQIARALKLRLVHADGPATHPAAVHPQAFEHYLHARFLHNRRAPGDLAAAESHYLKATGLDANFGRAWAGLAGTLLARIFEPDNEQNPDDLLERVRDAVERAVALEPGSAEVQVRTAQYYFQTGDLARAREHRHKARDIDPDHPLVLGSQVAYAHARGEFEEAVGLWERVIDGDPLNSIARSNYANDLAQVGRYEDAFREFRRARELSPARASNALREAECLYFLDHREEALRLLQAQPHSAQREALLAIVQHALGQNADAEVEMARLMRREDPLRAELLAQVYAQRGELDAAFAWIQRARTVQSATAPTPSSRKYPGAGIDLPLLSPLHADPRWQRLLYSREF
jgi:TolB-like protein/DNA-binding winged helix-turn-helix (wHTH) protein/Flp pilus assembly protein TadD